MAQEPVCVTRDEIMKALDVRPSSYLLGEVDRACQAGTRAVEGLLHRSLFPEIATRYFDWPSPSGYVRRIDFDEHTLISATSVVSNGITLIEGTDFYLEPVNEGPPFDHLELNRDSSLSFAGGPQRAVAITGLWGIRNDERSNGTAVGSLSDSTTTVTLSVPASVGAILRVGTERMQVSGTSWVTSAQTSPALTADKAAVSLAVSDGTVFTPGEYLLIDSERLQVDDVAGNTLTVRRAVQGSLLAAHTLGAVIYWQHALTVERGSLGTTAAAHSNGSTVYRWMPAALITEVAQAYAEDFFLQRNSGYARTVGAGDNVRAAPGRGISQAEARCRKVYGRGYRTRAI
jgi:hypothetical protein